MFGSASIQFVLGVLLFTAIVSASPVLRSGYSVKESHHVLRKWSRVGPAPGNHVLKLQIGMKPAKFDELERHLYEVSDPSHERYGQHLSAQEVEELVKPPTHAIERVHEWLLESGIEASQLEYSPAKDWIRVALPVKEVERLLDTEYSIFKNGDSTIIRTPEWSLPDHLHEHIEVIQPTNSFFQPRALKSSLRIAGTADEVVKTKMLWTEADPPTIDQACDADVMTPDCLRVLYSTYDYVPQATGQNKIGIANYLEESNNRSDIAIFLQKYRPEAASAAESFEVVLIAGAEDEQTPENATEIANGKSLEGNLDAEYVLALTWPTPMTAFSTGGRPPFTPDLLTPTNTNEPYLDWLQYVLSQDDLPQVISTSYGDDEQTIPFSYARSVCNGFAQLGARGVSVLFASGDEGVGTPGDCFTNDGDNTPEFLAQFPGSCPYVTTVGGTMNINPEIVAYDTRNGYVSGGGFSNYFPMPDYQKQIVPAYIDSLGDQFTGLYNTTGRGYPDIAAQSFRFQTVWNGMEVPLDGTSASCPTASSIISLVNDALIANNKSPLGFLNPWLYSEAYQTFTDVTDGFAFGCGTSGFPAQAGWDAVTGFGTPNFMKLKDLAIQCWK